MEHEPLRTFLHHLVNDLLVTARRTKGDDSQALGLTAGEYGRTVRAWEYTDFARDLPNLIRPTTIDAHAAFEDLTAHVVSIEFVDYGGDLLPQRGCIPRCDVIRCRDLYGVVAQGLDEVGPFLLVPQGDQGRKLRVDERCYPIAQRSVLLGGRRDLLLHRVYPFHEPLLQLDELLDCLVRHADRAHDLFFGDLVHQPLDHGHRLLRSGNGDLHAPLFPRLGPRVDHELSVFVSDLHAGDRSIERGLRDHQRRRCSQDAQHAWRAIRFRRQNGGDNLHLVTVTVGEERPNRPVYHACAEDGDVTWTPLAFEEATGDLPAGVEPFLIVNTKRKIVGIFCTLLYTYRYQDTCVSITRQYCATRLFCQSPGFQGELFTVKLYTFLD